MIKRTTVCLLALLLCLLPFAASCDAREDAPQGGERFTDALGREVILNKTPERVAALLGSFADVWILAGGELCAAPEDAWEDFGLSLPNAVNLGGAHSPSLELLLSASPDFVIASASSASNLALREPLEDMGIPVAYFDVDNFDDYLAMLKVCTDLTGRADRYVQNGTALASQIDAIKEEYARADVPLKERRVLLLRVSSSTLKAKGSRGTVLGEMLADMGCINVADSDTSLLEQISAEAIIREDPHHVFAVTMGSDTDGALRALEQMMDESPALRNLTAMREGRFHVMDKTLFNLKPNARWAEAYEVLYETLTKP